ncbi:DNA topoisomerase type II [Aureococcus anophagefferens]|nr:DNA topoisomerase type II [Aureococcus anophagefferens]
MRELNLTPGTPYRKCARVVGEVLGKFHPHGDNSVYDALVRMAQDFVMSARLVDGHGNFGSVDADPPAAMRYTECKLTKFAYEALLDGDDLGKANRGEPLAGGVSVNFSDNFDASEMEPDVLPARVPVLLVNGAAGIAVGMATSIPPHNLGEVCDAALVVARAAKRGAKASDDELSVALPAPDFPTGGLIMGTTGVARAYATGQGSIVIRAKTHFEKVRSGRNAIVATELPYQVIKSELLAKTADAINARRIEGIADLRDESGREGTRVVFELKRDAQAEIVLSNLFKSTRLQTSFPANIVAVDHALNDDGGGVRSRERRAAARLHIVEGLCLATANVDAVVALIRASDAPADAKAKLVEGGAIPAMGALSEDQASAVLALTLSRLTTLEADKLDSERKDLEVKLEGLRKLMSEDAAVYDAVVDEVAAIKKAYPTPRRSRSSSTAAELRDGTSLGSGLAGPSFGAPGRTLRHLVTCHATRACIAEFGAQSRGGRGGVPSVLRGPVDAHQGLLAVAHDTLES